MNLRDEPAVFGNPKSPAEALYQRHTRLVEAVLSRGFSRLTPDQREAAGAYGRLGLWKAALNFDAGRGTVFSTYAVWRIRGEISHYFSAEAQPKNAAYARCMELDAPRAFAGGGASGERTSEGGFTLAETLADNPAYRPGAALLAETGFEALLSALPPREQVVVRWLYQEDETLTALAKELGVSRESVSAVHRRALGQLRQRHLSESGFLE